MSGRAAGVLGLSGGPEREPPRERPRPSPGGGGDGKTATRGS